MASRDSTSSRLANSRSIARASRIASLEISLCASASGFSGATLTATTFGLLFAFVAALGDDIKLFSLFDELVFAQLHLAVGHALAGLHVVFHAVPRADEVHFGLGKVEPL